jgi:hypothetical protein
MNRTNEVSLMITAWLRPNPLLERSDPAFFTSLAADVREIGPVKLALDCFMTLIDLRSKLQVLIKERSIVPVFALLSLIDDIHLWYQHLRTICAK